ncbi:hypothetical protein SAMN04487886_102911 [Clostridium sp. DSM 8431]|uniref:hypothetical protein n=1 Tax=Clostridium sp. DSM 8431 TaxID=1761781 RepID=UPI0008EF6E8F|nr:hypothetical protein [Clostridium sp. DSM 8431]SFU44608.1 hypothetical protein SAMN04487886_102911 [Clostridium sp. DSM 8431]
MNILVIGACIFAVCFAVYNFIFYKKKKVIYSLRAKNFIVTDDKFYKAQLIGGIINSVILILLAVIGKSYFTTYEFQGLTYILTFWVLNLTLKAICLIKNYASIPGVL